MIGLRKSSGVMIPFGCAGRDWFESLHDGQAVYIKQLADSRTLQANRMLWGWNNEIKLHLATHHGQLASADQWHDILVAKLMPSVLHPVRLPDAEEVTYKVGRMKTSQMNKKQMSEYMEKLQAYCADTLGLVLESEK